MAYFRENEPEETKQQPLNLSDEAETTGTEEYVESDYDDGFDDLTGEPEEEISDAELKEIRKKRFLVASGAGNAVAVVAEFNGYAHLSVGQPVSPVSTVGEAAVSVGCRIVE